MTDFWTDRRVLVTGGAGFIGSFLSEALVRAGADVTVFTRYSSRGVGGAAAHMNRDLRRRMRFVMGDLKDPAAVRAAAMDCDTIFHLGAHIGIPYSYVHPVDVVQTNVMGTTNVLEAARSAGVSKLVIFSTSEVYGTALYAPIDEAHPLQAQSPYAASKIAADQLGLSYHRAFGTPVAICRPFNTYGPRQPARAIIPTVISQALRSDEVRLGSLHPTRDLLFVEDTVAGAMRVAEVDATVGEVTQLGTGVEISIGDLVKEICAVLGKSPRIIADQSDRQRPAKSEVNRLIASTARAAEMLDWAPEVSLAEGLGRTAGWVEENLEYFTADGYQI
ncbi:SDR family NAD(P)-dependent oxidoreductase [Roseovarius sp.]|uniref:SDR family NAD(P)-dependent oxidoreductase n=1 Tax=Roseovarius sp. TaxID=1486281 RepID=UPI003D13D0B0